MLVVRRVAHGACFLLALPGAKLVLDGAGSGKSGASRFTSDPTSRRTSTERLEETWEAECLRFGSLLAQATRVSEASWILLLRLVHFEDLAGQARDRAYFAMWETCFCRVMRHFSVQSVGLIPDEAVWLLRCMQHVCGLVRVPTAYCMPHLVPSSSA